MLLIFFSTLDSKTGPLISFSSEHALRLSAEAFEMAKVTDNSGILAVLYVRVRFNFNKIKPPSISKGFDISFFFNLSKMSLKCLGSPLFFMGPTFPLFNFDSAEENFSTAFSKSAPAFNSISNLFAIRFAFWKPHRFKEIKISENSYSFSILSGVGIKGIES